MEENIFIKNAKNVYSQNGDDGVIEALLNHFKIHSGVCCEFGASDGLGNANTALLWKHFPEKWKALLIEPRSEVLNDLRENTKNYTNVKTLFETVTPENINDILNTHLPSGEFHILSIDIDGDDLKIFEALTLTPSIIAIEATHVFGDVDHYDPQRGSTPKAIVKLAAQKNYFPVVTTGNIYLIHNSLLEKTPTKILTTAWIENSEVVSLQNLPRMVL
jgi:hypothetical protein